MCRRRLSGLLKIQQDEVQEVEEMQVVDEMQEEEVDEMLEEVEEMQVVAIRQSSRRRCGQVVLSLRPRHLPNSLGSQCRCKTSFQCNNFLVLKIGFCGIHTYTPIAKHPVL